MTIVLNGSTGITDADGSTVLNTNDFATLTQAQNGTDNTVVMTPLRASDAITALSPLVAASLAAGAVGTYMYANPNNSTIYTTGATIAGSLLLPSAGLTYDATSGGATRITNGSALTGTWRCMGNRNCNATIADVSTLWLRIS